MVGTRGPALKVSDYLRFQNGVREKRFTGKGYLKIHTAFMQSTYYEFDEHVVKLFQFILSHRHF